MEKSPTIANTDIETDYHENIKNTTESVFDSIDLIYDEQIKIIESKNSDDKNELLNTINNFKYILKNSLDSEALTYLSELDEDEFSSYIFVLTGIIHDNYEGTHEQQFAFSKEYLLEPELHNKVLYKSVYGYNSKELKERKESKTPPTAQELMMGCFKEMLEKQTRQSVLTLRSKGYSTVESGYRNKKNGSQFFHLKQENYINVPENIIAFIHDNFGVSIIVKNKEENDRVDTRIEFIPANNQFIDLKQWEVILNTFGDMMPEIGEVDIIGNGSTSDFLFKATQNYNKEEILKTAKTNKEIEFIEKLYECQTDKEVKALIGFNPEDSIIH